MSDFVARPLRIIPAVQNYAWGKIGRDSLAARIVGASEQLPYSELWYGAHPSAPALAIYDERPTPLGDLLRRFPNEILGSDVVARFGSELPFLFKILSVRTALSIQAHPSKSQAERFHAERPDLYPDANHKPELGIALSPVSLLYGFRPEAEIRANIARVPELQQVVGERSGSSAREIFQALLESPAESVRSASKALYERLSSCAPHSPEEEAIAKLTSEYPDGDVGIFCFYLLRFVELQPGEAVFTEPGIPHAYLSGDLAECMANSDNVVRVGLTPKPRDVARLLEIVDARDQGDIRVERTSLSDGEVIRYETPAWEFEVEVIQDEALLSQRSSVDLIFANGELVEVADRHGGITQLRFGEAALIPASLGPITVTPQGGTALRCFVPARKITNL